MLLSRKSSSFADRGVQYRDPDVVKKIKEATGDSIHKALDAISEASSQKITIEAFAPGPGKIVTILPPKDEARALRNDVTIQGTCARLTIISLVSELPLRNAYLHVAGS